MLKYKDFVLIKPDENQKIQILKIIEENGGSVFHEVELNIIVASQFNTDLFYFVNDPNNISALSPVHKEHLRYGLVRFHFKPLFDIPYAGFVGEQVFEDNEISLGLFESIRYMGFPYRKDLNIVSSSIKIGETAMVDLTLDEDEIFSRVIHSKRRNMIRKALKEGVVVKIYSCNKGMKEYWPLLEKLHDRIGLNKFPYEYYNMIIENFGPKDQAFILVAYKNGEAIAGVFILGNKNYMHYYKGASRFGIKNDGQGELLQWEAIKLSKSLGAGYYDLCNLDKDRLPEIYRFKTGISRDLYQYPVYSSNSIGFKIVNRMKALL